MGRISNILNHNNQLELVCDGLEKSDIIIIWEPELEQGKTIFENGKQTGKIGHSYGPNRFKIIIFESLEFNFGHFKTNNWHAHKYYLELKKDKIGYKIAFTAKGPDYKRFEQYFNLEGIPNGLAYHYFQNAQCLYKGRYDNGLKQGQFIYYYENGKTRTTVDYLNNKIHGYNTTYDENGNIKYRTQYEHGKEVDSQEDI
jgi:antitoxin component YwqK of YwqJK toxin-antitoxin module